MTALVKTDTFEEQVDVSLARRMDNPLGFANLTPRMLYDVSIFSQLSAVSSLYSGLHTSFSPHSEKLQAQGPPRDHREIFCPIHASLSHRLSSLPSDITETLETASKRSVTRLDRFWKQTDLILLYRILARTFFLIGTGSVEA